MPKNNPRVLISYSHDSENHKDWVLHLASELYQNGIVVTIDQWELNLGDDIAQFMEKAISQSDRIIIVCTDTYVQKANNGIGGVGYEKQIITADLTENLSSNKYIPLLRNVKNNRNLPNFLKGRLYIDFSDGNDFNTQFTGLLREVYGVPDGDKKKPELGSNPFHDEQEHAKLNIEHSAGKASSRSTLEEEYKQYILNTITGKGSIEYLKKQAPKGYARWSTLATTKDPIAQLFVGRCFQEGIIAIQNYETALQWLNKAASQENDYAMTAIGYSYESGEGVDTDDSDALLWYSKAAELGNVIAMNNLGALFKKGVNGTKPDYDTAFFWFSEAAKQEYCIAQRNIGDCYAWGYGVAKNIEESDLWYKKAAENGDLYTIGRHLAYDVSGLIHEHINNEGNGTLQQISINKIDAAIEELKQMPLTSINGFIDTDKYTLIISQIQNENNFPALMERHNELISHYMKLYENGLSYERLISIDRFTRATVNRMSEWYKVNDYNRIVEFWQLNYADLKLNEIHDCEYELIHHLRICISALLQTGHDKEAKELVNSTLNLCDRVLSEQPWEWYLKDNYMGLCFDIGSVFHDLTDYCEAQTLLRRAWSVNFEMFGKENLDNRYQELPVKGMLPADVTEEDRAFFLYFSSEDNESDSDNENSVRMFTVPCDFGGEKYPFDVYVYSGKNGYRGLLHQIRWLKERRGGILPQDVRDAFFNLHKVAIRNNVNYSDLCSHALNSASEDDQ